MKIVWLALAGVNVALAGVWFLSGNGWLAAIFAVTAFFWLVAYYVEYRRQDAIPPQD